MHAANPVRQGLSDTLVDRKTERGAPEPDAAAAPPWLASSRKALVLAYGDAFAVLAGASAAAVGLPLFTRHGRISDLDRGHLHVLRHRQLQPDDDGDDRPAPAGRSVHRLVPNRFLATTHLCTSVGPS